MEKAAMTTREEEYWQHPSTKCEIELLHERLQTIIDMVGSLSSMDHDAAEKLLPRLYDLLHDVAGRLHMLQLNLEDPP